MAGAIYLAADFSGCQRYAQQCVSIATLAECLAARTYTRGRNFCSFNAHDAGECDQRAKHAVC